MSSLSDSVSRSIPIPLAQRVLGAKYRLVRPLVAGGMGTVWIAEHLNLRSAVAVKLLEREIAATEEGEQRFQREACTAASLRSPHVVQILDHGVDAGTPYIVMELLDGESLASRLQREQRLSTLQTERIVRHVARAVGRAHEAGIVHRDLKPSNIFIVANDEEELVKVLDFGIAKTSEGWTSAHGARTRTGTFLGTPGYVSPEQAEGASDIDHRTDIWSLGVIAFECLLGQPPFLGESFGSLLLAICSRSLPVPSEHGPVPRGFDGWFARACARAPEQRFQSAREAAQELRRALDLSDAPAESGAARASSALEPAAPPESAPASLGAASAAPFDTTSLGSSSAIPARRAGWPARWAWLASGLGAATLGLLARSCLPSSPVTVSAPAMAAAPAEAPRGPVPPSGAVARALEPAPRPPPPGAVPGAAGPQRALAPSVALPVEPRVREARSVPALPRPEPRRPAAGAAPKLAETPTINLGLVPAEKKR